MVKQTKDPCIIRLIRYSIVHKMLTGKGFEIDPESSDLSTVTIFRRPSDKERKNLVKLQKSPVADRITIFQTKSLIWRRMGYSDFEEFLDDYIGVAKQIGENPFN